MRFATYLAPCNRPLYEFVADRCGATELIDGCDWRELAAGDVDVAFVCSPPLVWLGGAVEAIAAPVLDDERFRGRPLYTSEVVVNRDSAFESFADLAGCRWAVNEPSSWSGYWVTLERVGTWSYFREVVAAGFHERALGMVAAGEVDAAAIDCHVLAVVARSQPELVQRLRTVASLGPAPSQPVVVRAGLDAVLKQDLVARLVGLRDRRMLAFGVDTFAPAPDYSAVAKAVAGGPVAALPVGQDGSDHWRQRQGG